MSQVDQRDHSAEVSEDDQPQSESPPNHTSGRKQKSLATRKAARSEEADESDTAILPPRQSAGRRIVPVHESRIKDRPAKVGEKDSSLKIKIELDLEVEVELYARVKGDVTIGLM